MVILEIDPPYLVTLRSPMSISHIDIGSHLVTLGPWPAERPLDLLGRAPGRVVQVDTIKTRVESAYGFSS